MRSFKIIEIEKELKRSMKCPRCKALNEKGNVICKSCGSSSVQLRMYMEKERAKSMKK